MIELSNIDIPLGLARRARHFLGHFVLGRRKNSERSSAKCASECRLLREPALQNIVYETVCYMEGKSGVSLSGTSLKGRHIMKNLVSAGIIAIVFCGSAAADVIHFKDGGKVEGIVANETGDRVVIDMGFGTMTVKPEEVDYVEESSPEDLERLKKEMLNYRIGRGEWAPEGYEDLKIVYGRTKGDRAALEEARNRQTAISKEIQDRGREVSKLLETLDAKGKQLNKIDPENDVKGYNQMATEINSLNVEMDRVNKKLDSLYDEEKEINAKLARLVSNYRSSFELFRNDCERKRNALYNAAAASEELQFLEEMEARLKEMTRDFRKDVASYTPEGDHVIVDALINGKTSAQLMVDTGASIVIITNIVARRLGLDYGEMQTEIDIVMADGSAAKARPVILKSVKVGDAKVENVQAAVIESDDIGGVEGLLGMSFLSQFVIKFDGTRNEIILEKVL